MNQSGLAIPSLGSSFKKEHISYNFNKIGPLKAEQIEKFFTQGFVIIKNLFDKNEVDIVQEATKDLTEIAFTLGPGKHVHEKTQFVLEKVEDELQIQRLVWAGGMKPELILLGRQKKITAIVSQLLGCDEADHIINQLHPKYPNDHVTFNWHQDVENRCHFDENWQDINGRGSFVQVLTAIDPMNEENGTLCYIPFILKNHKQNLHIKEENAIKTIFNPDQAISFILDPGDTIFMSPYLIHGSQENRSDKTRILFINGFSAPGANHKSYPGVGSCERIKLIS